MIKIHNTCFKPIKLTTCIFWCLQFKSNVFEDSTKIYLGLS